MVRPSCRDWGAPDCPQADRRRVELETPELASLEAQGHRLCPEELGLLAKKLANAKSAEEVARVRESITRGFYGI